MKLNCDLGESYGSWKTGMDESVMPFIDQANIACGFHAGDPMVLAHTLSLAKQHNVEVGAHPSYPDLNGFGRRSIQLSNNELRQTIHYQIAAVWGMASVQGIDVHYIKPHGALYNDMMKHDNVRAQIMQAVADFPLPLSLMLQATPKFEQHKQEAAAIGLNLTFEAFADRCYTPEGLLVSRGQAHAVHDKDAMLKQVTQLMNNSSVTAEDNSTVTFPVDSICVHGDNLAGVSNIEIIKNLITNTQ